MLESALSLAFWFSGNQRNEEASTPWSIANCDEAEAKGRPISGVLGTAASRGLIGPARKAARPA